MTEKTPVVTDKAPKALPGIYSQAIKANGFVFVSGAVPMDAESGQIIPGDIQAHTVRSCPATPRKKKKSTAVDAQVLD